ncbi:MAG: hypothetical protein NTV80_01760 [Verrucomicrobia bacterium]|nr:hypothetical protein [Verrucomicrobiota bacterium]
MPEPSLFRHYQIVQDTEGNHVELTRNDEQVNVLACDTVQMEFVHCHVLLKALTDKAAFEENCRKLQQIGHPLLARLTDFGEDEGNPFYITTNVDGETLQSYLGRQTELPGWLAVMVATRALEAVAALVSRTDLMPSNPLESLRLLQIGPQSLQVQVADYRLLPSGAKKVRGLKTAFEKQAKFLRSFLVDQSGGGPTLPDAALPSADFTELLNSCLDAAAPENASAIQSLREALLKLVPDKLAGEIPAAQKPRALLAQQLASYQEVARAVVNRIRIQSQRLDMANPYSMRGTLTKTGRQVLVEQVLPPRLAPAVIAAAAEKAYRLDKKSDFPALISVALLHEAEGLTCVAEELAEGFTLADLLRERRALNVHETYIVLAGLDGALSQLEKSGLQTRRLRLEDLYLLTGFPREDARSNKLLLTKLTDWPAFSVMLRAHPTLAAMSGRGTDPALALSTPKDGSRIWDAAWLASVGRFLLALEPLPGAASETPVNTRETETVARLLEDELAKVRQGSASKRGDFLARYARVVQHHDLVKPVAAPPSEPLEPVRSKASRTRPMVENRELSAPLAPLTTGFAPAEKPSIGFAELLFRGTSETSPASGPDWAKTAVDAPPTIHPNESLLPPDEFVPFWLRAAVFIGGSMVVGGMIAHLSGDATWLKKELKKPVPAVEAAVPKATAVPRAVQVFEPSPKPDPAPMAPPTPEAAGVGLKPPVGLKGDF